MNPHPPNEEGRNERQLTLHRVVDRQHNNVVASLFVHPADWKAQSEVVWNFQNLSFR